MLLLGQSRSYSRGSTETLLCSAVQYRDAAIKIEGDGFRASEEERLAYTEEVAGSIPAPPTKHWYSNRGMRTAGRTVPGSNLGDGMGQTTVPVDERGVRVVSRTVHNTLGGGAMQARRTKTKASPDKMEKGKQVIEGTVIPAAKEMPGFKGGYWLVDRETGEGLTFTFFDTTENLQASAAKATQIRGDAVRDIGGDIVSVDEFEVMLDTGPKVHHSASHARVAEFEGDPSRVDEAVGLLEKNLLPAVKNLPGFQGGFWIIDRTSGNGVGVTLFDSSANLAASREAANAVRERTAAQMPGKVSAFKEYEVMSRAETPAGSGIR
jgi:hypothetical protein